MNGHNILLVYHVFVVYFKFATKLKLTKQLKRLGIVLNNCHILSAP